MKTATLAVALILSATHEGKGQLAALQGELQTLAKGDQTVRVEIRHLSAFKLLPFGPNKESLERYPNATLVLQDRPASVPAIADLLMATAKCLPSSDKESRGEVAYWMITIGTPAKPRIAVITFDKWGKTGELGETVVDVSPEIRRWIKAMLTDAFCLTSGSASEPILKE